MLAADGVTDYNACHKCTNTPLVTEYQQLLSYYVIFSEFSMSFRKKKISQNPDQLY
jgi:hypothetical protein